jgi:hypothetical protein
MQHSGHVLLTVLKRRECASVFVRFTIRKRSVCGGK